MTMETGGGEASDPSAGADTARLPLIREAVGDPEVFWRVVLATVRELHKRTYYELLGVSADAAGTDIRDAYYALVRHIHPDRYAWEHDPARTQALVRLYARVGEAYRVLSSPERRRGYDESLGPAAGQRLGVAAGQQRVESGAIRTLASQRDPRTLHGQKLYRRGLELYEQGDVRSARAQWALAAQFEPGSKALRDAMARLDGEAAAAGAAAGHVASHGNFGGSGPAIQLPPELDELPATAAGEPLSASRSSAGTRSQPPSQPVPTLPPPAKQRRPVTVRCTAWDKAAVFYERKVRRDGLFVGTPHPPPVGSMVPLVVQLPDGRSVELAGLVAEVASGERPGMRLGFAALAPEAVELLEEAVERARAERDPGIQGMRALAEGRHAEAMELLLQALEREPASDRVRAAFYQALAHECEAQGRPREAAVHRQTAARFEARPGEAS